MGGAKRRKKSQKASLYDVPRKKNKSRRESRRGSCIGSVSRLSGRLLARLFGAKRLANSLIEGPTKSLTESLGKILGETVGETFRSKESRQESCRESRIRFYAWLSARLSWDSFFTRVTLGLTLSYEEYSTLSAKIEAILNSRSLTLLSSDHADLSVLTPSYFLIGEPLLQPVQVATPERTSSWILSYYSEDNVSPFH